MCGRGLTKKRGEKCGIGGKRLNEKRRDGGEVTERERESGGRSAERGRDGEIKRGGNRKDEDKSWIKQ